MTNFYSVYPSPWEWKCLVWLYYLEYLFMFLKWGLIPIYTFSHSIALLPCKQIFCVSGLQPQPVVPLICDFKTPTLPTEETHTPPVLCLVSFQPLPYMLVPWCWMCSWLQLTPHEVTLNSMLFCYFPSLAPGACVLSHFSHV